MAGNDTFIVVHENIFALFITTNSGTLQNTGKSQKIVPKNAKTLAEAGLVQGIPGLLSGHWT